MEKKDNLAALETRITDALKTVFDPEIPLNIYDLGLIYKLEVTMEGTAEITMTLTNPNCPVADQLIADVKKTVLLVEGVSEADVILVFEPEWTMDMMSDAAMLELGLL
jgi:FeS assembly SUF system protein